MKRFILSFSFFFSLICGTQAQIDFAPDEPTAENTECGVAQSDMFIKNTSTTDSLQLMWRIDRIDVPVEWDLQICDSKTCYPYKTERCPDDKINIYEPDQGFTYMVKAKPNDKNGVGEMNLVLFNPTDESDIIATISIVITITNCVLSTDGIEEGSDIRVYPNPTSGTFKLTEQTNIDRIGVYNIIGKEVVSFNATANGDYDISNLENGMFLVKLLDQRGKTVKVTRLSKN